VGPNTATIVQADGQGMLGIVPAGRVYLNSTLDSVIRNQLANLSVACRALAITIEPNKMLKP
jgi:hypothetical protein